MDGSQRLKRTTLGGFFFKIIGEVKLSTLGRTCHFSFTRERKRAPFFLQFIFYFLSIVAAASQQASKRSFCLCAFFFAWCLSWGIWVGGPSQLTFLRLKLGLGKRRGLVDSRDVLRDEDGRREGKGLGFCRYENGRGVSALG